MSNTRLNETNDEIDFKDAKLNMKIIDEEKNKSKLRNHYDQAIKWLSVKTNLAIFFGVVAIIVLLIIIISLTANTKSKNSEDFSISINERINCLPWVNNKNLTVLKSECSKNKKCVFKQENDQEIPECFYDTKRIQKNLIDKNETDENLKFYRFKSENITLLLTFEQLDDSVLRFKVKNLESILIFQLKNMK
jgi:hypothetical protein